MKRWLVAWCFVLGLLIARPLRAETVRVLIPEAENLQFLAFWVALGGGEFAREGLEVEVVTPNQPRGAMKRLARGEFDVAVLPPPMYLRLISEGASVVVVANLLRNDPINLIVRRSVAEARHVTRAMPLADRLRALKGLRIGVAPHPPTRLRRLFADSGLDADRELEIAILKGENQNAAFGDGLVDALYAHTPFLERALVEQDAVLIVDQSGGEVPSLAGREIHSLVCTQALVDDRPDLVAALVRAIAAAERRIHADPRVAVDAVLARFPAMKRVLVETIVNLYVPAIPDEPTPTVEGVRGALAFFPAGEPLPDLSRVDLSRYVDDRFARGIVPDRKRSWRKALVVGAVLSVLLAFVVVARRRRLAGRNRPARCP